MSTPTTPEQILEMYFDIGSIPDHKVARIRALDQLKRSGQDKSDLTAELWDYTSAYDLPAYVMDVVAREFMEDRFLATHFLARAERHIENYSYAGSNEGDNMKLTFLEQLAELYIRLDAPNLLQATLTKLTTWMEPRMHDMKLRTLTNLATPGMFTRPVLELPDSACLGVIQTCLEAYQSQPEEL